MEQNTNSIENLYYPESLDEFVLLLNDFIQKYEKFKIIGFSSNTLFLPSYHVKNLVCTKYLDSWRETDNYIICECGVLVGKLSKIMISKGYVGFEGLTDLPGTIAAIYGNCGCRGCSVNALVDSFTMMDETGTIVDLL